jgi:hypothetical protein
MKHYDATTYLGLLGALALIIGWSACQGNPTPAVDYVPDAATAVKIAEAVWIPIYGERQVLSERPFHAVLQGKVWQVYGSLVEPPRAGEMAVGGTVEATIDRRTGKVLRVSHGK